MTDYVATRWYRSPELLLMSDSLPYGKEVDIWAVGCIMGEITDGQALFPGESEVDQLYVIQRVLGPLPDFLQEEFEKNPRFIGLTFPDVTKPETLERHYGSKMGEVELEFLKSLLEMDPRRRLTAQQALAHRYFDGMRSQEEEQTMVEEEQAEDEDLLEKPVQMNNRALSPDAYIQGKNQSQLKQTYNQALLSTTVAASTNVHHSSSKIKSNYLNQN